MKLSLKTVAIFLILVLVLGSTLVFSDVYASQSQKNSVSPGSTLNLFLSDDDLNLNHGIISAGEQIEVGGAATIEGILMAQGKPTVSKLVKTNKLHGQIKMSCGTNMVTPFVVPSGFRVVAWRAVYN